MSDVASDIKNVISTQLGFDRRPVEDDDTLVDDLGCDSLDAVELAIALEVEFGIEIPDCDMESFPEMTVKQLIDIAVKHGAGRQAA
jgi:acyl carrier protein